MSLESLEIKFRRTAVDVLVLVLSFSIQYSQSLRRFHPFPLDLNRTTVTEGSD
jgi:hypothetical protein